MPHPPRWQTPRREPPGRPSRNGQEGSPGNMDSGQFQHKGKPRILTEPSRHWLVLDKSHLQNLKPPGAGKCG